MRGRGDGRPGPREENTMACVHRVPEIHEVFRRSRDCGALSCRSDSAVTTDENERHIGQPFAGYAEQEKTPHAIVKMDGMGRKFVSGAGVFWAPGPFDRVHSTESFSATKSRKRLAAE